MALSNWTVTGPHSIVADPTGVLDGNVLLKPSGVILTNLLLNEEIGTATPFSMTNLRVELDLWNLVSQSSILRFRCRRVDDDNYYQFDLQFFLGGSFVAMYRVKAGLSTQLALIPMPAAMIVNQVKQHAYFQLITLANGDVELGFVYDGVTELIVTDAAAAGVFGAGKFELELEGASTTYYDDLQITELVLL